MIIYHGSIDIVSEPEIREPNRTLDFGNGFYLTSSFSQAEKWVKRKLADSSCKKGYVSEYEFDPSSIEDIDILKFEGADEKWLRFVMANRTNPEFKHKHDIVIGPVANDRVYAAFALYEARLYDEKQLITELRTYKLVDQILLHTAKSLLTIRFVNAKEIKP